MKKTFLTYVVAFIAMLMFYSCDNNSVSGVFDTPFPLDEINAYLDLPFDSATFVSNMGDTVRCSVVKEFYEYTPYKPHKWEGDDDEGEEGEGDEDESGENLPESYGIENYLNRIRYLKNGRNFLSPAISISDRYELICSLSLHADGDFDSWVNRVTLKKPNNEIFSTFQNDTIVMKVHRFKDDPLFDPTAYAYLVRGKGITKFIRRDGIETWHMLESEGHR